jgi:hypothetical protein
MKYMKLLSTRGALMYHSSLDGIFGRESACQRNREPGTAVAVVGRREHAKF